MLLQTMEDAPVYSRASNVGQALWSGVQTHKLSLAEVLITGLQSEGDQAALVSLQWPRAHYFYSVKSAEADTLLIAETMRQITVALAHSIFGVELSKKFILLQLQVDNLREIPNFSTLTPTDINAHVRVDKLVRKQSGVVEQHISADFSVGSSTFASGSLAARIVDTNVYLRLRNGAPTAPASSLESHQGANVQCTRRTTSGGVLKQTEDRNRWILTPDTSHPILFDHPLDHVPGMFLVECLRQAASYRGSNEPRNLKIDFIRMIELSDECILEFKDCPTEQGTSTFLFIQNGRIAACGTLTI